MDKPASPYRRRTLGNHRLQPESLMMGYGHDPAVAKGALKSPLYQTSSFAFRTAEEAKAFFEVAYGLRDRRPDEETGLVYSRIDNPDLQLLEGRLALWENAEAALLFSSGMAAITATLLTFIHPGDTLLWSDPVYGGTEFFIENVLPGLGVSTTGFTDPEAAGSSSRHSRPPRPVPGRGDLRRDPGEPTNRLVDIAACVSTARKLGETTGRKPLVIVDNSFLGPLWRQPLDLGADLALYSLTKGIGGHADLVPRLPGCSRAHSAAAIDEDGSRNVTDPTAWLALEASRRSSFG
jgi:methionine-gamma-lyase